MTFDIPFPFLYYHHSGGVIAFREFFFFSKKLGNRDCVHCDSAFFSPSLLLTKDGWRFLVATVIIICHHIACKYIPPGILPFKPFNHPIYSSFS